MTGRLSAGSASSPGLDEQSARTALASFGLGAEIAQQPAATHDRQLRRGLRLDREVALIAN